MKKFYPLFLLLSITLVVLAGCSVSARLIRTDDGMATNLEFMRSFTGHNRLTFTNSEGEVFDLEYTTLSGGSFGWGSSSSTAHAVSGSVSAYGWANSMGFSFSQPGVQYGAFIATGNKGTVIDGVYAVDAFTNHGHGVAKDNKDRPYRVIW